MAFPDDSLTEGEHVVLHLHPHWKAMITPVFWTVVTAGAVIAAATLLPSQTLSNVLLVVVGAAALLLFLWLAFWPFVVWRSTHFVFTNERVLLQMCELALGEGARSRKHLIGDAQLTDVMQPRAELDVEDARRCEIQGHRELARPGCQSFAVLHVFVTATRQRGHYAARLI